MYICIIKYMYNYNSLVLTITLSDFFSSWGSLDQSGLPKHIGQLTFLLVTAL